MRRGMVLVVSSAWLFARWLAYRSFCHELRGGSARDEYNDPDLLMRHGRSAI